MSIIGYEQVRDKDYVWKTDIANISNICFRSY